MNQLAVVTCHFNPCGYDKPRENWYRFLNGMRTAKCDVYTIELHFPRIPGRVSADRSVCGDIEKSFMWQKESLLNVLIKDLVNDYWAIAWVDADLIFTSHNWVDDTLRELGRVPVCQLFSQCHWLDRDGEIEKTCRSVGWNLSTGRSIWNDFTQSHPGFAWAARSALLSRHRLYPYMITGAGDTAMLRGFTGDSLRGFDQDIGERSMKHLDRWSQRTWEDVKLNVGFVMGSVLHMWHGDMRNRANRERRQIMQLVDPDTDLVTNEQGILEWTRNAMRSKPALVKRVRNYLESRDEDGCTS